jgi:hypothetical protein
MKKLTLFATALAAVFAASSCSNDDSLAELNQAPKGKPFVINVANNDGTRGADITAVSKFNLSGTYGTTNWIPNYLFTKPEDAWVATGHTDLAWPTAAQVGENTHTFYATCDNTTTPPTITDGTFDYTVPAAIADQKDLLVAAVTDVANENGGEPLALTFKHALASLKIRVGFDASALSEGNDIHIKVKKITLYNIATSGTFDFSNMNTNPWTVSETPNMQDIVIELDEPLALIPVDPTDGEGKDFSVFAEFKVDDATRIFVLPHKPAIWDADNTSLDKTNDSYIGVTCQLYEYTGGDAGNECGFDEDDYNALESDEEKADYMSALYNDVYIDVMNGKIPIDGDWLNDKCLNSYIPQSWSGVVTTESHLNSQTENQYEEVYLPLKMKNGFGFNKTNIINVLINNVRSEDGANILTWIVTEVG